MSMLTPDLEKNEVVRESQGTFLFLQTVRENQRTFYKNANYHEIKKCGFHLKNVGLSSHVQGNLCTGQGKRRGTSFRFLVGTLCMLFRIGLGWISGNLYLPYVAAVKNITKICKTPGVTLISNTYIYILFIAYGTYVSNKSDSIYWKCQTSVTYRSNTSSLLLLQ